MLKRGANRRGYGKSKGINRVLTLELARVTERAAVAAAGLIGRGDEKAADQAAVMPCVEN